MTGFESLTFWGAMILLLILSLTTMDEWWKGVKKIYAKFVEVFKWQPYLGYIIGDTHSRRVIRGGRRHFHEQVMGNQIFPRSRRTTYK